MTTSDAATNEPAAAAPEPPVAAEAPVQETDASAPVVPDVVVENGDAQPAGDAPKKRGRKRKVSVTEDKATSAGDGDAVVASASAPEGTGHVTAVTAAGAEKSPKEKKPEAKKPKAAKATEAATPVKRKPGRPRKIVKEESEDEDDGELVKRVDALPEDVKAKFGTIVWAKMVGFPYWPALITDPRRLHPKFHAAALKEVDTKYFVCFYQSNDFSSVLYKNIEAWDDSKHDYRAGHPVKDAKAPKRRSLLMVAIEQADKDAPLPVEERMNGLMKATPDEAETSSEEEKEKPVVPKRKPGRPLGSKNKPKPTSDTAASADAPSPAPKAKRGRKKSVEVDGAEKATTPETPEEEETAPPLSKDEIKAKVASRKTPMKKAATAEEKSAAAAAKKAAKAAAKIEAATKGEVDSKRKKEIELVVPRKSVKSADIREATEEAARKKPGPREKPKDKGEYKVGSLTLFAGKMNRLFANESSKNNDELILLLTQLFEEKMVYRSDVERSGVAAVIAVLRKSSNPTVAQTASAVRKHLMRVLNDDVTVPAPKKQKAETDPEAKATKKQKTSSPPESTAPSSVPSPVAVTEPSSAPVTSKTNGSTETPKPVKDEPKVEVKEDSGGAKSPSPAPVDENKPLATQPSATASTPQVAVDTVTKQETPKPASPVKADPLPLSTVPKPDPSGDKGRMNCIEMLKKSLAPIGEKSTEIAREIEAQVFERFSENLDEYQTCSRLIIFGLKKNAGVRERLKNGDLHALELAYSPEEILNA